MNERSSVAELAASLRSELQRYSVGQRLPSSRELVRLHQVSPVTLSRAVAVLAAEGLVVSRPGAGVYRAEPGRPAAPAGDASWQEVALSADAGARGVGAAHVLAMLAVPPDDVIDLNGGYLHPSLQPEQALAAALARAGRRPGAWGRPPVEGLPDLRAWFADAVGGGRDAGHPLAASDVLVTAGGQGALTTALRSLAAPGAPVLVESPTYPGALAVARAAGLRPVPVPVDADGVRTDLLADAFEATGARLFVCQPLFQNPTGAVLSAARRSEVLRIARAAGAFVVEDDFARHLVHADAPALPSTLAAQDPDGVVVHIRSLSKAASPSLRVGALTARGPAWERLRAAQVVDGFFVPRPLQEAALELVAAPAWRAHLRRTALALQQRRQLAATELLRLHDFLTLRHIPHGGYHLWLRLPDGSDPERIAADARRLGAAISPGRAYFPAEPPAPHLRLSYAAAPDLSRITDGIRLLGRACADSATPQTP
ncbi:PLP-dependent aminotransferase family protein [Streptacidiphilus sp. PB12-B1b]|uniref:aminotransferase-like domain-containing protein n=1 Tax=Streptacidiphilus sp. PB12-B1b TaxID=2705012 RepID=UPI0015F9C288|nr:PLP-dependent aminotransferase family protein [Streptacidiphilus sp. PB12-B1b]QMU78464.1 PLP-dependent aminotransferase family protein [Streptacidiphilus sp. PB12-B1b]